MVKIAICMCFAAALIIVGVIFSGIIAMIIDSIEKQGAAVCLLLFLVFMGLTAIFYML